MGSIIRPLLFAALLVPAPVHAQQADAPASGLSLPPAGTTPAPESNRQGPELNVYRDPVTPRPTPPAVTPTVTPPPSSVQPVPQSTRPAESRPTTTAPEPRSRRPAARTPTPSPAETTPAPASDSEAPAQSVPVEATPPPLATPNAAETPAPVASPTPAAPSVQEGSPLPWIIGGALLLVALAAAFLLRRRRPAEPAITDAPIPTPAPKPAETVTPPAPATPVMTDRPWLDMDMAVGQARYSLIGVTIAYSLILHNRGSRPAQDILIRGIVGNAGPQQAALLQSFFAGEDGLPLHSAVSIAPGETVQLTGELRLSPDDIMPVTMGQRSLLIPLAAFDMVYRWDEEGDAPSQGRTARAFIVGQEQEPPAQRLAPLRLDQGPRQYRRPAARAAAELTPA